MTYVLEELPCGRSVKVCSQDAVREALQGVAARRLSPTQIVPGTDHRVEMDTARTERVGVGAGTGTGTAIVVVAAGVMAAFA